MALSIIYVWIFQFYFSSSTSTLNCRHIQVSLNTAIFTGMPQIYHNLKYVQNLFLPPFSSSLLSPSFSVQNPYSSWILSFSCAPWLIHLQVFFFFLICKSWWLQLHVFSLMPMSYYAHYYHLSPVQKQQPPPLTPQFYFCFAIVWSP